MLTQKPISIAIPGSKSISNRALILATLSNGTTTLKNFAICDDTHHMLQALRQLGVKINQKDTTLKIQGINNTKNNKLSFPKKKKITFVYTGNAGTTTRFLTALSPLTGNKIIIDGDARMRERPIKELVKALNTLGAKITSKNGYPPIKISQSPLQGGILDLPGNISSQYLSAILMVAPFAMKKTIIKIEQKLYSKPYTIMTLKMMRAFGFSVMNKKFRQFVVRPIYLVKKQRQKSQIKGKGQPIKNKRLKILKKIHTVESDASSASYFGAYAALHPDKRILLQNIHKKSLQGDTKFLELLKKMGCKIIEQKNGTIITGPQKLKSLNSIDMNNYPDLVMTFAVLALFTKNKTRISNIGNLRIKETDRISALENELKKLGAKIKTGKDWIEIEGLNNVNHAQIANNPLKNSPNTEILIHTYNDHRMAMSFAVLKDIFHNLIIKNPQCVSKSYPGFWQELEKLIIPKTNLVLTGLRGSGKSKIGKIIAEKLKYTFIDIDEEIEKQGKNSIKNIVNLHGWEYFRAIERQIAKKVSEFNNTIISTGGGTIIDQENEKFLKKHGKIIYLCVQPEICARHILNSKNRPPLTDKKSVEEEIRHLYKERDSRYRESANLIFKRSEDLENDAEEIIKKLNLKKFIKTTSKKPQTSII